MVRDEVTRAKQLETAVKKEFLASMRAKGKLPRVVTDASEAFVSSFLRYLTAVSSGEARGCGGEYVQRPLVTGSDCLHATSYLAQPPGGSLL
jgi:hypothetical protein